MLRRIALVLGSALVAGSAFMSAPASAAPGDLVINGEVISDAATYAAAKKEGELSIYSSYPAVGMQKILNGFTKDTGIKTQFVRLPTQNMYPRVIAEFSAGKLNVDYIDLTDATLAEDLVRRGILNVPHKVPDFAAIDPKLKDPEGRWYALIRPVELIVVNNAVAGTSGLPTTWADVLKPKWKGKIGLPSIAGGSGFSLYVFLRERVDPDYWNKLAQQHPRVYPSAAPVATDLARGETSIALTGPEQTMPQIIAGAPLKLIFPKEGIPSFAAFGGISSTTKHPKAAALFLDWLTSKRAADFIGPTLSYAINPDAPTPQAHGVKFPPASTVWSLDVKHWEKIRDPYMSEWRKIFGHG
jgi:iron(III) transport system substrate-binding protein